MAKQQSTVQFPKHFLWGAATSAHQVEGGMHNQWSEWEKAQAKTLAAQSQYQYGDLPNWPHIASAAKDPNNYISGKAANHAELYAQDFALAKKMGLTSWRFSVEWSRIEPEEGAWNAEAIKYYKAYLAALADAGLEPVVTLFHFTLPVWFAAQGGFAKRDNVKYFVRFVDKLMDEIGATVRYVVTINEPCVYVTESYDNGTWPPNVRSKWQTYRVLSNLAYAHNQVAKVLHAKSRRFKVAVAKNSAYTYPGDDAWLSRATARVVQFFQDDYFLRKVVRQSDYIAVNYYFSNRVYGYRIHNPETTPNDLGWTMQPDHLELVLERLWGRYKLPLLVTENGVADERDQFRKQWLTQSILAMQRALGSGVELLGYMHWSFLDNFEWDKGFWPRFGLFAVDYKTYKRTPRPSALWFARVLQQQKKQAERPIEPLPSVPARKKPSTKPATAQAQATSSSPRPARSTPAVPPKPTPPTPPQTPQMPPSTPGPAARSSGVIAPPRRPAVASRSRSRSHNNREE